MQVLAILFGFAFTISFCFALGLPLASRLPLMKQERWPFAFLLGSAILSGIMFLLCVIHQVRPAVMIALAVAAGFGTWKYRREPSADAFPPIPRYALYVFLAVSAPFTLLYFANAMGPEWSPDGSSYHLGWVAKYAAARGFVSPLSSIYGMLSQGIELLFLNAFLFGKHSAAAMVHWAFLLDLVWLMISFARRIARPQAGLAAAFFLYASPVVGVDATSAYIDLATACIGFGLFYLVYIWDGQRQRSLLVAAGLLAGFAYGAKYTVAILGVWAVLTVLWRSRSWKDTAIIAGMSLVLSTPWMIRNAIEVGNPVAPFFNRFFPNPNVHILFEKQYSEWLRHYGTDVRELPLEVTIRGEKTAGSLGYLFLLTPLALLALRKREGRWLFAAALFALIPYPMNVGTRFLLPALPFLSIALAMALDNKFVLPVVMLAHAALAWPGSPPGLLTRMTPLHWRLEPKIPWKAAFRKTPEAEFLQAKSDGYRRAKLLDGIMKPGERALGQNGFADAYASSELLVGYQSAHNEKLQDIYFTGLDDSRWPRLVWTFKFPANRPVRRFRLEQTAVPPSRDEQWNITEVRLYRDGAELPRDAAWRLTASPNPWDIQMAFDNSPATRWRSWETARPGMHVDTDLGSPQSLSSVVIETSMDNANCKIKLLVDSGDGNLRESGIEPVAEEVRVNAWMRREATRELLDRGIQYLFFAPDDYGGRDLYEAQKLWGITFVGEESGTRLFRINPYVLQQP
jgi:hypothetical protein